MFDFIMVILKDKYDWNLGLYISLLSCLFDNSLLI